MKFFRRSALLAAAAMAVAPPAFAEKGADSLRILGEAEAAASKDYAVFEQKPDLAVFLLQLKALVGSLKDRTTLVLDEKIPPLNLLNADKPAAK